MAQSPQRTPFFTDQFLAHVSVGWTAALAAVFFGIWMLGVWMGDVHTTSKAVHGLGAVIAIGGVILFLLCAWIAVRARRIQNRARD